MSDDCKIDGKMENIYAPEDAIKALIAPLFPDDMVFTQYTMDQMKPEMFKELEVEDRLAALILYSGYSIKDNSARKAHMMTPLWRIIVVTPSELYKSVAGVKLMEVINHVKGKKIYPDSGKELVLETDVREFNMPDYVNSLVGIPAVFSFDVVI